MSIKLLKIQLNQNRPQIGNDYFLEINQTSYQMFISAGTTVTLSTARMTLVNPEITFASAVCGKSRSLVIEQWLEGEHVRFNMN